MSAEKACIFPLKVYGARSDFTDEKANKDTAEKALDASENEIKDSGYENDRPGNYFKPSVHMSI